MFQEFGQNKFLFAWHPTFPFSLTSLTPFLNIHLIMAHCLILLMKKRSKIEKD